MKRLALSLALLLYSPVVVLSYHVGKLIEKHAMKAEIARIYDNDLINVTPTGGDDTSKIQWAVSNPYHMPVSLKPRSDFHICKNIELSTNSELINFGFNDITEAESGKFCPGGKFHGDALLEEK